MNVVYCGFTEIYWRAEMSFKVGHSYRVKPEFYDEFDWDWWFWGDKPRDYVFTVNRISSISCFCDGHTVSFRKYYHMVEEVMTLPSSLKYIFENNLSLLITQEWCGKQGELLTKYCISCVYGNAFSNWVVEADKEKALVALVEEYKLQVDISEDDE